MMLRGKVGSMMAYLMLEVRDNRDGDEHFGSQGAHPGIILCTVYSNTRLCWSSLIINSLTRPCRISARDPGKDPSRILTSSTAENIVVFLWEQLSQRLPPSLLYEVWQSSSCLSTCQCSPLRSVCRKPRRILSCIEGNLPESSRVRQRLLIYL